MTFTKRYYELQAEQGILEDGVRDISRELEELEEDLTMSGYDTDRWRNSKEGEIVINAIQDYENKLESLCNKIDNIQEEMEDEIL